MLKVRILQHHWLPKMIKYTGITLYPYILLADSFEQAEVNNILNHEFIHVAQIRKLGFIKFYISYLWDAVQVPYLSIPYEQEAYAAQATTPHPPLKLDKGFSLFRGNRESILKEV